MTEILAVLRSSTKLKYGFIFNTIVQSAVEQFMLTIQQSNYILVDPATLKFVPISWDKVDSVGHYIYDFTAIAAIRVNVKITKTGYTFTVRV